jgi:hypothetical protein
MVCPPDAQAVAAFSRGGRRPPEFRLVAAVNFLYASQPDRTRSSLPGLRLDPGPRHRAECSSAARAWRFAPWHRIRGRCFDFPGNRSQRLASRRRGRLAGDRRRAAFAGRNAAPLAAPVGQAGQRYVAPPRRRDPGLVRRPATGPDVARCLSPVGRDRSRGRHRPGPTGQAAAGHRGGPRGRQRVRAKRSAAGQRAARRRANGRSGRHPARESVSRRSTGPSRIRRLPLNFSSSFRPASWGRGRSRTSLRRGPGGIRSSRSAGPLS